MPALNHKIDAGCWPVCRWFHRHRAWLHLQVGGRVLRQRGHRHFRSHVHLLSVDQVCQDWVGLLGSLDCTLLLLHGE